MFAAQRKSNRKSVIGNVYQKWKNPLTKKKIMRTLKFIQILDIGIPILNL